MENNCPFCFRLAGHAERIAKMIPQYAGKRMVYYETSNFFATAELHPVVKDPYFLIVPKKHFSSFSQLDHDLSGEMNSTVKHLISLMKKKSYILFEHGEITDQKKAQSVYHAHTHLILTDSNYFLFIAKKMKENGMGPKLIGFDNYSTIKEVYEESKGKNYLLFRQENVGFLVKETATMKIPSQLFRRWMYDFNSPDKEFIDWKKMTEKERSILKRRLLSLPNNLIIE